MYLFYFLKIHIALELIFFLKVNTLFVGGEHSTYI